MSTELTDWARSALTVVNAAFGITIFTMLYHTKTPLIFTENQPRICEYVYDALPVEEEQDAIGTCLALQIGDVFAQVFSAVGIALMLAGFVKQPSNEV